MFIIYHPSLSSLLKRLMEAWSSGVLPAKLTSSSSHCKQFRLGCLLKGLQSHIYFVHRVVRQMIGWINIILISVMVWFGQIQPYFLFPIAICSIYEQDTVANQRSDPFPSVSPMSSNDSLESPVHIKYRGVAPSGPPSIGIPFWPCGMH